MELRQLGTRGPWVSPIGLGSTKFGRLEGVKYPQAFTLPSDGQLTDLLALAKEWGINLVDTAPAYGNSEARIGALIGRDDHWRMATKVGETFVDGRSHFDFSPAAIRASVEHSRRSWTSCCCICRTTMLPSCRMAPPSQCCWNCASRA